MKIPATVITGFLGAGKTTLVRHVLEHAAGRRIAVIVNEFGSLGIDEASLRGCGIPACEEGDIVELSNGCLCCTVADEFLPAMEALLDRPAPPEHILIETSGLALPKPLLKAFNWPSVRSRVTVDGVVALVDGPAVVSGRFADDPTAVASQRLEDENLDHDNPLAEVYEDQVQCADLVVLNKTDLMADAEVEAVRRGVAELSRAPVLPAREGRVPLDVLLGLRAAAEDDLGSRPSHHDAVDGAHEHDDFTSFVVSVPEQASPDALAARVRTVAETHDILRTKGFVPVAGKALRLHVQAVGARVRHEFDRAWRPGEERRGQLVVIGRAGLDADAITAALNA